MSDNDILDLVLLQGYLDNIGTDVVLQMLDLYIKQSEIYLEDIDRASIGNSQIVWHDACHKMKGAAGSVGLKKVHANLVAIENLTETSAIKQQAVIALTKVNQVAIEMFQVWIKQSHD